MNSFNHYAYGAVGAWLYSTVAGIDIDPERPGYKHVLIRPQPGGGLTHVRASLNTMYGTVTSAWEIRDGRFAFDVTVPPNAYATVTLPRAKLDQVAESGTTLAQAAGIRSTRQAQDNVVVEIGSGRYRFVYAPDGALSRR
jgi:alpha-L-rhamnosidase